MAKLKMPAGAGIDFYLEVNLSTAMLAAIQLMCVGISAASEQSCDAFPDNPTPAVIATTCKEFCNNKCAFLNSSAGKMDSLLLSFLSFL